MPKLLVLFDARSDDVARLADAVAEGARGVRFAEVDVRRAPPSGGERDGGPDGAPDGAPARQDSLHRALESAEALSAYDAIVVGIAPGQEAGADEVSRLIEASAVNLANKVASAFTPASAQDERRAALWSVLTPMGERGMIIVPPRIADRGDDDLQTARNQG